MRIGTATQNDLMLHQLLRQQSEVSELQQKVATGKKYNDVQGFGAGSAQLANSHSLLNQIENYQSTNQALLGRLGTFDNTLTELESIAGELRDVVQGARGLRDGTEFRADLNGLLERATSVLNTRSEGRFLFGGKNTDQAPSLVTSDAELVALGEPPAGVFFSDSGTVSSARLDERTELSVGVTASQVATELMTGLQRLMMFDEGTLPSGSGAFAPAGSFDGILSDNALDFLEAELPGILNSVDTLQTAAAENGVNIKTVEAVQNRLGAQSISLTDIISHEEDADLATVANKLNQQQLSLEASLRMIAEMRSFSLLNVL